MRSSLIRLKRILLGKASLYPPVLRPAFAPTRAARSGAAGFRGLLETRGVFAGCRFTSDWLSGGAFDWHRSFSADASGVRNYMEIGSYEGRSAIFAAWLFPNAHITCIDIFSNKGDPRYEVLFDENMKRLGDRVTKIKGHSLAVLPELIHQRMTYDIIYIDGGHTYRDVLLNSAFSWQLLAVGGYLVWDDYLWRRPEDREATSKDAIDQFVMAYASSLTPVFVDYQVCVRKLA
jgi:predicted O-methyltransferase YrrM